MEREQTVAQCKLHIVGVIIIQILIEMHNSDSNNSDNNNIPNMTTIITRAAGVEQKHRDSRWLATTDPDSGLT